MRIIDIHSHVLPGVDDGSKDEKMTAEMLARAVDAGISAVVCTPHVYKPEHQVRNRKAVPVARAIAHENGIPLFAGCEFNYRALVQTDLKSLASFCIAKTPCILIEFSNDHLFPGWESQICEMIDAGYLPIIAHPERYTYVQKDIGIAQELCSFGCELQLDAGGLMAGLFNPERKIARRMLEEGMVSYIASDAHRPEHYKTFAKALHTFKAEWPKESELSRRLLRPRVSGR